MVVIQTATSLRRKATEIFPRRASLQRKDTKIEINPEESYRKGNLNGDIATTRKYHVEWFFALKTPTGLTQLR